MNKDDKRPEPKELSIKELSIKLRELERHIVDDVRTLEHETGINIKIDVVSDQVYLYAVVDKFTYTPIPSDSRVD